MSAHIQLLDHPTRDDLRVYLERLQHAGQPEVRLVVRGGVLAVFGCTQAPVSLTDNVAVVLTMRSFALRGGADSHPDLDVVVLSRALLDRLARLSLLSTSFDTPDVTVTAAWAGVLPPVAGWVAQGLLDAESLRQVAAAGIERVAATLPTNPGEAVVRTTRAAVWGLPIAPGLPAAVAFAAETLGFLRDETEARVSQSVTWIRVSTSRGEVFARNFVG